MVQRVVLCCVVVWCGVWCGVVWVGGEGGPTRHGVWAPLQAQGSGVGRAAPASP